VVAAFVVAAAEAVVAEAALVVPVVLAAAGAAVGVAELLLQPKTLTDTRTSNKTKINGRFRFAFILTRLLK
jgi:hypothetical protein